MFRWRQFRVPSLIAIALGLLAYFRGGATQRGRNSDSEKGITIRGDIGLASVTALSDTHFRKMADSLQILASSSAAQSADWEQIKQPLARAAEINLPALNWFALPDGSYWSVQNGKEAGNLTERDYFRRVLEGQAVIGDLVVSKGSRKPVAIVALPVRGEQGSVVGILGASVHLDRLSALLGKEMALDNAVIFYSFDKTGRFALVWDPSLIYLEAEETREQDVIRAVHEMLSKEQGVVSYRFRGKDRTVLFRRSRVTGWWHAFGVVPGGRETGPSG